MKQLSTPGDRMRFVRRKLGLSQEEVARKVGVTASQVSNYENNRNEMPYDKMRKFCEHCQVSTNWLLGQKSITLHLRGAK